MKRFPWVALILAFSWLPTQAIDPPFAHDKSWFKTFEEAELAQGEIGRSILVLFWSAPNRDTERLENDLKRWKGAPELLGSYVKVALKVEEHREVAAACKVFSVPSLALIGNSNQPELSQRVIGTLENTENREEVMRFLETGYLMATLDPSALLAGTEGRTGGAGPAEIKSVTQLLQQSKLDLELRKYNEVFEGLERAIRLLPSGTSDLHLKIHLQLADLYYKAGRFEEAIDHYRKTLESLSEKDQVKVALHIFVRLALLLNDQGDNEEALKFLRKQKNLLTDPEKLADLEEERKAFEAGLYVLAGRGYPEVGLEPPKGFGAEIEKATEEAQLSFEEKLEKVQVDLDFLESSLKRAFETNGAYPEFLDEIPELQPAEEKIPKDPFSRFGTEYQYLHLQDPEDYSLYSIGPDGKDQFGEVQFLQNMSETDEGDIVRNHGD